MSLEKIIDLDRLSRFKDGVVDLMPDPETDPNVENMLDTFELDYVSSTSSVNRASGVSF